MNAFVLSGGGNLGSIQAGMLKAMLQAGITPGALVGTSIGAANAAFMAADPTAEQAQALCRLWAGVRSRDVFPLNPLAVGRAVFRQGSIFPPDKWRRFLERAISYERIEDAAVPLRIVATDYEKGTPVILDSGPVIDAVMASTALPVVFPPHHIGKRHYLDGALSDQVPIRAAVEAGATTVYVMAVSFPCPPPHRRSARGILRHSFTILLFPRIRLDALDLPSPDEGLRIVQVPSVSTQVALWDLSQTAELIDQACEETSSFLANQQEAADHTHSRVATVPEMTVEVELQESSEMPTRSADPDA